MRKKQNRWGVQIKYGCRTCSQVFGAQVLRNEHENKVHKKKGGGKYGL